MKTDSLTDAELKEVVLLKERLNRLNKQDKCPR